MDAFVDSDVGVEVRGIYYLFEFIDEYLMIEWELAIDLGEEGEDEYSWYLKGLIGGVIEKGIFL